MEERLFVISLKSMSKIASKPIELISDVKTTPRNSNEFITIIRDQNKLSENQA